MGLEAYWADLKTTLQMEMLRNCSPVMAFKKLRLRLIGQNLIRRTTARATAKPPVPLDRLSFKVSVTG